MRKGFYTSMIIITLALVSGCGSKDEVQSTEVVSAREDIVRPDSKTVKQSLNIPVEWGTGLEEEFVPSTEESLKAEQLTDEQPETEYDEEARQAIVDVFRGYDVDGVVTYENKMFRTSTEFTIIGYAEDTTLMVGVDVNTETGEVEAYNTGTLHMGVEGIPLINTSLLTCSPDVVEDALIAHGIRSMEPAYINEMKGTIVNIVFDGVIYHVDTRDGTILELDIQEIGVENIGELVERTKITE